MKRNSYIFCLFVFTTALLQAQLKNIHGQLVATGDVEGVHILNKTASKYAISNQDGSFVILAKALDTLMISSLKYNNIEVIITKDLEDSSPLLIQLTENINELNQVVIGPVFTGSLASDIENLGAKTALNFYDLGIPGNTRLPLTQNEKKLHDADAGPWGAIGLGFSINFHKLLNRISGRTKKLKTIVSLDDSAACMNRLRRDYESIIFENEALAENLRNEYFLFCEEDPTFLPLCRANNDLALLEYLQKKLNAYLVNREIQYKN